MEATPPGRRRRSTMSRGLDADTFTRNAEGSSATNGEQSSEGALPLGESTLEAIAGRALVPTYERGTLKQAIVRIGVGGFHRAHQAVYLDDVAEQRITTEWGARGIGLLGH